MILYHGTTPDALALILRDGLKPKAEGWCVYLSPLSDVARHFGQGVLLEVDVPEDAPLTAVDEETAQWELLCWQMIPADRIRVVEGE